jgi:hypothetical protein
VSRLEKLERLATVVAEMEQARNYFDTCTDESNEAWDMLEEEAAWSTLREAERAVYEALAALQEEARS